MHVLKNHPAESHHKNHRVQEKHGVQDITLKNLISYA